MEKLVRVVAIDLHLECSVVSVQPSQARGRDLTVDHWDDKTVSHIDKSVGNCQAPVDPARFNTAPRHLAFFNGCLTYSESRFVR